jgi:hypothetical protein
LMYISCLREKYKRSTCKDVMKEEVFFRAKLLSYGLSSMKYKIPYFYYSDDDSEVSYTLELVNKTDGTDTLMTPSGVPNVQNTIL